MARVDYTDGAHAYRAVRTLPPAVAAGLHRVLRPQGRVLVRGFFSDMRITGLFGAFPGIDRAAATFPSTGEMTSNVKSTASFCSSRSPGTISFRRAKGVAWRT